jgi:hypothetical protein
LRLGRRADVAGLTSVRAGDSGMACAGRLATPHPSAAKPATTEQSLCIEDLTCRRDVSAKGEGGEREESTTRQRTNHRTRCKRDPARGSARTHFLTGLDKLGRGPTLASPRSVSTLLPSSGLTAYSHSRTDGFPILECSPTAAATTRYQGAGRVAGCACTTRLDTAALAHGPTPN